MEMVRVRSSAIRAVGYDSATGRMRIQFIEGNAYDFCRVPEYIHVGLMTAPSKGNYFNDHIRDRYQC
ncbi:MAG TPA: KTSC domain-containing protein [Gammaproteobacteria bacterium]|nr:KTSC domain-containing protein [Gammaproteobacteria bacterium]